MFLDSVWAGLWVLGSWKVWVGMLVYVLANLVFLISGGAVVGRGESGTGMGAGCLLLMLGQPILQGASMSIFVCLFLPIMLGGDDITSVSLLLPYLWPIVKAGLLAVAIVVVLCFFPLIGSFIAHSPGIQTFLIGAIIFRFVAGAAIAEASEDLRSSVSVYPSFWASIGYLIIAGVLVRLLMFAAAFLTVAVEDTAVREYAEWIPVAVVPSVGVLGGLLPLFMYAQHVRLALQPSG